MSAQLVHSAAPALLVCLLLLGACGERMGAAWKETTIFLGARLEDKGASVIEVSASVAHSGRGVGALYSDCVAASYAKTRGFAYIYRIFNDITGHGDIVTERTRYLMTVAKAAQSDPLGTSQITQNCMQRNIPTK